MSRRQKTWKDAILAVLKEAAEPLHYKEGILPAIERGQHRAVSGATPEQTVAVELGKLKKTGHVVITAPGFYALSPVAEGNGDAKGTTVAVPGTRKSPAVLFPFGRFWQAPQVEWGRSAGKRKLLGIPSGEDAALTPAENFADHPGVYLLHHAHSPSGIVYVGQSSTSIYDRLNHHYTKDRSKGRWDAFSWFGFSPITKKSGSPQPVMPRETPAEVIEFIEAILIDCLAPSFNDKSELAEYFVEYEQYPFR